jgi:hypothetical protein
LHVLAGELKCFGKAYGVRVLAHEKNQLLNFAGDLPLPFAEARIQPLELGNWLNSCESSYIASSTGCAGASIILPAIILLFG